MIAFRPQTVRRVALILGSAATFVSAGLFAQAPAAPYINRNLIVLDPAHGGQDNGVAMHGQMEKNVILPLVENLKILLTARGFTVVTTRDAELPASAPLLTPDQRAGVANHLHPAACIIFHATDTGTGIHLSTSSLEPSLIPYEPSAPVSWERAQGFYLPQSRRLANDLGLALARAKFAVLLTRALVRPLDNLTCPAIAVELAPLPSGGSKPTPASDAYYQQRVADVLSDAILSWRDAALPRPAPKPADGVAP